MESERRGLFARSGIGAHTVLKIVLIVIVTFTVGIGAGWFTTLVPGIYRSLTAPEVTASPEPSASPLPSLSVEPSAPPSIVRELDEADAQSGVIDLDVPFRAGETFTPVAGSDPQPEGTATVRWVRIELEDGLTVNGTALADFVMGTLDDNRGWGSGGTITFARTDGVADIRVVVASPRTAAALCSDPQAGSVSAPVVESSAAPTASAGADGTVDMMSESCASQTLMVLSLYDWSAGLPVYGDDRADSRRYMVSHFMGTLLDHADAQCSSGRADVMVDQTAMPADCQVNPWPNPDADPSPAPAASAS
ncbi:DUF3152 domain-containing protein [Demequina capsici]|uniref:DUF3152 domain-containing protein n=1 Tax=Demequina capsici TaxID=3075620 RepID=A0AA96F715_9MICO|nr:DUF3152 domain-containing protein [Demequina sp. OYTSA14]WNM23920.1 DUF3152 domain-containing protein [Demequina sp. OYTSA14]